MKRIVKHLTIIFTLTTLFILNSSFVISNKTAVEAEDIIGTYISKEGTSKVRIYLAMNDKYAGKIVWLKEPKDPNGNARKDNLNPNEAKRQQDLFGLVVMKNFEYDHQEKRWINGTVYDPKSGRTYNGYISIPEGDKGKLALRGYIFGMPLLGRTDIWTRIAE